MVLRLMDQPQLLIMLLFCLMFALTFHEFAHAYVAALCGDNTAKVQGRLSVNPLVHLDMLGTVMVLFAGFGYAKPVPIDPRNFRYKNADFYVAAAGPGMNFLLALLGGGLLKILVQQDLLSAMDFPLHKLLYWFIFLNMNLGLFNLIPIGPLDGSYVLPHFLPPALKRKYQIWNLQYGTPCILLLFMLTFFLPPHWNPFRWIVVVSQGFIEWVV